MNAPSSPTGSSATYFGIFLVSASTLMLEILMTRITSVVAWYHLAFFVISLAMLGMTAGAVFVFLRPERFEPSLAPRSMARLTLLFGLLMAPCVFVALFVPLQPTISLDRFAALLAYGGLVAVPFAFSGAALTIALTRSGLPPGRAYGIDLCGAAFGCVAIIAVLDRMDAPSAVLLTGAFACLAAAAFARAARTRIRVYVASAIVLLALALTNRALEPSPFRPHWVKGAFERGDAFEFVGWNTYSRVTVEKTVVAPPTLWAVGAGMPPELRMTPIPQRVIRIDGAAATLMASFDTRPQDAAPGTLADHAYLDWDVTAFAHRLRPSGPAAVIGVGGGRDVLEAARAGHERVVGIEINDLIVGLHRDRMADFSGVEQVPGVELVADEARSFLARDSERYSVITMSLIDTWATTGAGAYSLSENGLYTVEAWRTFLARLQPNGIFTVSRWYNQGAPGETARMIALAMETLWSMGKTNVRDHIIVLQRDAIATLLLSPHPFSEADIARLHEQVVAVGLTMLVSPRRMPFHPVLHALVMQPNSAALAQHAATQPLDISPSTDARPFFFNMLRPSTWIKDPASANQLDVAFLGNLQATQTLVQATLAGLLLTLATVLVPLALRMRSLKAYPAGDRWAATAYFAAIGLAFMFVEMALLSRLNVFIGHPTLALAALLGGIILFTGIGSLYSGRIPIEARPKLAYVIPLLPAGLVIVCGIAADVLMAQLAAASTLVRVLVSVALIAPPALGMGLLFPIGLRLVTALREQDPQRPDLGPWLWGINGACGVVASGLALGTSMAWGIPTTLAVGAALYASITMFAGRLARSLARR